MAAGGRKKRKLVIPPACAGATLRSLESPSTSSTTCRGAAAAAQRSGRQASGLAASSAQLACVTGLPHKHRLRVWTALCCRQQRRQPQASRNRSSSRTSATQAGERWSWKQSLSALHSCRLTAAAAQYLPQRHRPVGSDSPSSVSVPSSSLPSPRLDLINQRTVRV